MLDLKSLFDELIDEQYVIIKVSETFPEYIAGDDIDLLCRNLVPTTKKITKFLSQYIGQASKVEIYKRSSTHTQIDFKVDKKIHFRFDLHGTLPDYKRTKFKNSYFDIIIECYQKAKIGDSEIKVPHFYDDCILRYAEFNEYFGDRADKIKHANFIVKNIHDDEVKRNEFFLRLHHFLSFPKSSNNERSVYDRVERHKSYVVLQGKKIKLVLNEQGVRVLIMKILKKLGRK